MYLSLDLDAKVEVSTPRPRAVRQPGSAFDLAGCVAMSVGSTFGQGAWPNPSIERTHTGMALQALISFWALRALPARAAHVKR